MYESWELMIAKSSQKTLVEMIGATRRA